jgi:hypothetical protein
MASTIGSRLAFEKAKEAINRAGFSLGQAVLSQSFLRLEVDLSTSKTLYQFPVLVNDSASGSQKNTENRLNLQDAFYASSMGLYFAVPSSSTASNFQLITYPNTSVFAAANTATSLLNWYNSKMTLTINNRQVIPSYDLFRHYWAGQTQQSATTTDEKYGDQSAQYPIEPGIVFVGSKQNVLQVELPNAMAAIEANSRAVIIFRGHLAQNVTPVR